MGNPLLGPLGSLSLPLFASLSAESSGISCELLRFSLFLPRSQAESLVNDGPGQDWQWALRDGWPGREPDTSVCDKRELWCDKPDNRRRGEEDWRQAALKRFWANSATCAVLVDGLILRQLGDERQGRERDGERARRAGRDGLTGHAQVKPAGDDEGALVSSC